MIYCINMTLYQCIIAIRERGVIDIGIDSVRKKDDERGREREREIERVTQ